MAIAQEKQAGRLPANIDMKEPETDNLEPFTATEVAEMLKISYQSVLRWIKSGKLHCLPLRHKLIPRSELERFLREEIQ